MSFNCYAYSSEFRRLEVGQSTEIISKTVAKYMLAVAFFHDGFRMCIQRGSQC